MPGYFDAEIAGDRIHKIITQSITHLKILGALETFTRSDWENLKQLMAVPEYVTIIFVCSKYLKCENLPIPCDSNKRHSKSAIDRDTLVVDTEISNAIKYLNKNKVASEFCSKFPVSEGLKLFLKNMEELSVEMKERISRTPQMDKEHIATLKQLYSQNVVFSENISKYKSKLEILTFQHQKELRSKEEDMLKHLAEIEKLKQEFRENMRKNIQNSEERMLRDWKSSEYRQVDLVQEIKSQSTYVENIYKEKQLTERELRKRRFKVESQLVSVLEQYDTDIGDRQKQKEELVVQLEEARLELEQLEERYTIQELEYRQLTTDRENYDKRRFNEKILVIRQQIAARTIQRAFRKFIRRKYGKKKAKKGSKGKKNKG